MLRVNHWGTLMTKTHWLIALLLVTDVLAIVTRKTPFVITRTESTVEHIKERQKLLTNTGRISQKADSLYALIQNNNRVLDSLMAQTRTKLWGQAEARAKLPLTAVERIIRIHCTKSGYSRTITDGTKLRYEWKENYLMIMNGDSITVFGRFIGDDCEVTRGNI